MTDIPPLASLTIKDLRQLAGEHNVQNRSRLGKEELINALQQILAAQSAPAELKAAAAASEQPLAAGFAAANAASTASHAPAEAIAPSAPAPIASDVHHDAEDDEVDATHVTAASSQQPAAHDAEDDADEALRPSLASEGAAEPEEITAESVALLTQPAGSSTAPAHQPGGRTGDGNEGLAFGNDGQPLYPNRRRRRRRRRRGRGRDDQAGFNDQGGPDQEGRNGASQPGGDDEQDDADDESEAEQGSSAASETGNGQARQPLAPAAGQPRPPQAPGQHQHPNPSVPHSHHHHSSQGQPQAVARPPLPNGGASRPVQPMRNDLRNEQRGEPRNDARNDQRTDVRNDQRGEPRGDQRSDVRHDQRPDVRIEQRSESRGPRPRLDGQLRSLPSVLDRLCTFSKGVLELCGADTPTWAQPRLSELLAEIGMVMIPVSGQPHAEFHEVVGTSAAKQVPPGHIAEMISPGFALRGDRGDLFPLRKAKVKVAEGSAPPTPPRPTKPFEEPLEPTARAAAPTPFVSAAPVETAPGEAPAAAPEQTPAPQQPSPSEAPGRDGEALAPSVPQGEHSEARRPAARGPERQPQPPRAPALPAAGRPPLRTHARESADQAPALPLASQVPDELAARPKAEGFRSLGLNDQILADLAAIGYKEPTPIQVEAIPVVIAGKDLLGQAQTGTGKTAAFALPILQALYSIDGLGPVALVLCPTRELARQVHNEFTRMAGASGARAAIIYGGVPMEDQTRALERNPHVVIGTPGRIIDHMRRKTLDLSRLKIAVLDEADQMLDIGFWPDVQFIISHTPPARQTLLFSATFPDPIKVMAEKHMKEPVHVRISPAQITVEQVDQKYIAVPRERKNELLAHFIETQKPEQLVVFCKTKHQTDRVAEVLKRKNMSAAAIHGDLPQSKRERTLQAFRSGELQCLIATNVAARGLDIPTVSHVVNYDIPEAPEEYVHRIGRTARNGAKGIARTFITPEDGQFLVEIEKHIGLLLEEEKIEGFTEELAPVVKRSIADMPVGQPRLLKPLVGGIRLGRRR